MALKNVKRLSLLMAIGAVCAWSIDIPRIGFARDAQGRIVSIDGIAGNFISGQVLADDAVGFSWNGVFGIRKTDSTVEWWDNAGTRLAVIDAPAGDVVIGFGGQSALIYSKSAQIFNELKMGQWSMQQIPVSLSSTDEEVLALTGRQDTVDIAVRRGGGLFVVTFDRTTGNRVAEAALSRSATRALFLPDGAMAGIAGSTIWIARANGSEWNIDTGVTLTGLTWMGKEWIQASAEDRLFGLRIRAGADPALYLIPEAVRE